MTEPLSAEEREELAADARRQMFEGQEAVERPLTLAEATARAIKYQADHRQRRMEEAAAASSMRRCRCSPWYLIALAVASARESGRSTAS